VSIFYGLGTRFYIFVDWRAFGSHGNIAPSFGYLNLDIPNIVGGGFDSADYNCVFLNTAVTLPHVPTSLTLSGASLPDVPDVAMNLYVVQIPSNMFF